MFLGKRSHQLLAQRISKNPQTSRQNRAISRENAFVHSQEGHTQRTVNGTEHLVV